MCINNLLKGTLRLCLVPITFSIAILSIYGFSAGSVQPTETSPPAPVKFKKHTITDRQMFNNMEVYSFLIPDNWQVSGGLEWTMEGETFKTYLQYSAAAPNSEAVLNAYPSQDFSSGGSQYYPGESGYVPPENIEGIINEYYIPNYLPEAMDYKITNIVRNDNAARQAKEKLIFLLSNISVPILQMPMPNIDLEVYTVDLKYNDGSRDMAAVVSVTKSKSSFNQYGMGGITYYSISVNDMLAPFSLKEKYGKIFAVINNSSKMNFLWEAAALKMVATCSRQRVQSFSQAQRNSSQIISQGFDEMRQMQDKTNEFVNQSNDRIWNGWMNTSAGTSTFTDTQTNTTYNLPAGQSYFYDGTQLYMFNEKPINPADFLQGDYRELK